MRLNEIADEYSDRMNFLCVYIKEAHPIDGVRSQANDQEDILFKAPTTDDERAEIAGTCMLRYNFTFPMVLDQLTDPTEDEYKALPDRLYLLDAAGNVAWKSGPGPHYFNAEDWYAEIHKLVGGAAQDAAE